MPESCAATWWSGAACLASAPGWPVTPGRTSLSSPLYVAVMFFGFILFIVVTAIASWRRNRGSEQPGRNLMYKAGKRRGSSAPRTGGFDWSLPASAGSACPLCGTLLGDGAVTCPSCGHEKPGPAVRAGPYPAETPDSSAATGPGTVAEVSCPYCGTVVPAGVSTCPSCSWRLRPAGPVPAAAASSGRIGVIRRDVLVGGATAFKKDEWVKVELESPDPERPRYKYVVHSQALDKRFRLSDQDLSL